jgi:hypothetical protein
MNFLANLKDKAEFAIHKYTYDPEAEEYAAAQKASQEAAAAAQKARDQKESAQKRSAEETAAEAKRKQKEAEDRAARSQFKPARFAAKVTSVITTIMIGFAFVVGGILGAHYATNLNVYRAWPYRLLYTVYGFIFFPVVLVYVLGYRWWWKGKKPRYYSLLPLIPYFINQPLLAQLFSWLTFRPDDVMDSLQEWNPTMVQKGEEAQHALELEENRMASLEEVDISIKD